VNTESKVAPKAALLTRLGLDRFSAIYLWVGFMIVFGLWKSDTFLSSATFKLTFAHRVDVVAERSTKRRGRTA
jgi:hypothetical protein